MKNIIKTTLITVICFTVVATLALEGNTDKNNTKLSREEIKSRSFAELFDSIGVKDIPQDVFTLIADDFAVVTAGKPSHYNSMVASWGGWGINFMKPTTFLVFGAKRYTLKLMREEQSYTMAFFDEEYKEDIMPFGTTSGNSGDEKMKNTKLTAVETPAGNMAFKEAKLIIESNLVQVTTVAADDFYRDKGQTIMVGTYANPEDYHKIIFGEITNVWIRK